MTPARNRPTRVLIIGGSAAGMSAASKAKRADPSLEVVVFERSPHVAYSACGIPYFVAGTVNDAAELQVMTAEEFRRQRGIDVHTMTEVTEIDARRKGLCVRNLTTGEESEERFDHLVLAMGARPIRPHIVGADAPGVFTVQTLDDGVRLRAFIEKQQPKRAVIVGGGYIAMEMAEAFVQRGLRVTVVEQRDRILQGFEPEVSDTLAETLERRGVRLLLRHTPSQILPGPDGAAGQVVLETGQTGVAADLVLLATGVAPNIDLATRARVRLGPTGAIHTDWKMRTSQADILAAGDCVESRHLVSNQPVHMPLGPAANKQGRVAGDSLAGGASTFRGVVGTAIFAAFGFEVARTGLSCAEAKAAGFQPLKTVVTATTRASYFPGSGNMTVVVIADRRSRRLLGAQIIGGSGAGKRIDVFAAALHGRATIDEVSRFDLAYAPPFAPVWDPVLVAANVALKGLGRE